MTHIRANRLDLILSGYRARSICNGSSTIQQQTDTSTKGDLKLVPHVITYPYPNFKLKYEGLITPHSS